MPISTVWIRLWGKESPSRMLRRGQEGEQVAAAYLTARGFRILARNYRTRAGEIDIIAQTGQVIVFVEVKTRSSVDFGTPAAFVTYGKRQKLLKTALCYLHSRGADDSPARFDVVEVLPAAGGLAVASHIINAFGRE